MYPCMVRWLRQRRPSKLRIQSPGQAARSSDSSGDPARLVALLVLPITLSLLWRLPGPVGR